MAKRKIISIDRSLCNGCGLCTTACSEGALELDAEGKAVLVREIFCDGLGACLDVCPTGALTIEERESTAYDAKKAYGHVLKSRGREAASRVHGAGVGSPHSASSCPGSQAREIAVADVSEAPAGAEPSQLSQWPIQLHLVSPLAPYFEGSDLLVAADCTAFAMGGFHGSLLRGKKLIIACPKLDDVRGYGDDIQLGAGDDVSGYVEKLAEIIRRSHLRSLTVAIMTVPCCSGLLRLVQQAVEAAGEPLAVKTVVVGIDGKVVRKS